MKILKAIMKNLTILNLFLILLISYLAYFNVLPLLGQEIKISTPSIIKTKIEYPVITTETQTPMSSNFILIAEQNLFHPERKIPEKKEDMQLPKPEFVLYGTLITDTISIAYMEDLKAPHNTAGRGKRQKALQKGAIYSGFALSEIHHDRVVMVRGDERIEVRISDYQHKKPRATETAADSITSKVKTDDLATPIPDKSVTIEPQRSVRKTTITNPNTQSEDVDQRELRRLERETLRQRIIQR